MIRVVNLYTYEVANNEIPIFIGREKWLNRARQKISCLKNGTILGNPFFMTNESQRNLVCDKYDEYFHSQVKKGGMFLKVLHRIRDLSMDNDIALVCFCAPKRCHGETIKNFI